MIIKHHFLPLNGQKWLRTSQETKPLTNSLKPSTNFPTFRMWLRLFNIVYLQKFC